MPAPILFTDSAAAKVADLIAEEGNPDLKLRVFVQGGGCSGFQYGFTFDEITNEDDTTMTKNGVTLLIDAMSYQYLVGAEIDYKEDLQGAQFVIKNPNATTTCGCGSSFFNQMRSRLRGFFVASCSRGERAKQPGEVPSTRAPSCARYAFRAAAFWRVTSTAVPARRKRPPRPAARQAQESAEVDTVTSQQVARQPSHQVPVARTATADIQARDVGACCTQAAGDGNHRELGKRGLHVGRGSADDQQLGRQPVEVNRSRPVLLGGAWRRTAPAAELPRAAPAWRAARRPMRHLVEGACPVWRSHQASIRHCRGRCRSRAPAGQAFSTVRFEMPPILSTARAGSCGRIRRHESRAPAAPPGRRPPRRGCGSRQTTSMPVSSASKRRAEQLHGVAGVELLGPVAHRLAVRSDRTSLRADQPAVEQQRADHDE
jgi:iron-sulfur cluster insertion protein